MRKLTMQQYREELHSECTIDDCETCVKHARQLDIQIVTLVTTYPVHLIVLTGKAIGLTSEQMLEIIDYVDPWGDEPIIEDAEDYFALIIYSLARAHTVDQTLDNIKSLATDLRTMLT